MSETYYFYNFLLMSHVVFKSIAFNVSSRRILLSESSLCLLSFLSIPICPGVFFVPLKSSRRVFQLMFLLLWCFRISFRFFFNFLSLLSGFFNSNDTVKNFNQRNIEKYWKIKIFLNWVDIHDHLLFVMSLIDVLVTYVRSERQILF